MRIRSLVLLPLLVPPELGRSRRFDCGYQHKQKTPTRMREGSMFGGARRDRTADLNTASVALSQLSYGPKSKTANITSQRGWCQGRIRFAKVWFANLGGEKCLVNYC